MKLWQKIDKLIDLNEIESNYILSIQENLVRRINLSSLEIEFSQILPNPISFPKIIPFPDKKVFVSGINNSGAEKSVQYFVMSEDDFSIKEIAPPLCEESSAARDLTLGICFYDDSIFILKDYRTSKHIKVRQPMLFNRYCISQDRWTKLCPLPSGFLASCIGFDQKIIITGPDPGLLVYDIILDSYSRFCTNIFNSEQPTFLFKKSGKLYLLTLSMPYRIYSCDGVLSKWTFLLETSRTIWEQGWFYDRSYIVIREGSIYYLRHWALYEFDLKKLKSNKIQSYHESVTKI